MVGIRRRSEVNPAEELTGELMMQLGFTKAHVEGDVRVWMAGTDSCRLMVFNGYPSGFWCTVAKYQTPARAAASCAHFNRRPKTAADLFLLMDAIGIVNPTDKPARRK